MIIFNTTFHVEDGCEEEYLRYMKEIYIPEVLKNGSLTEPRLALIQKQHNEEGKSYALQFEVESHDLLSQWFEEEGSKHFDKLSERFKEKVLSFCTLLEKINLE